MAGPAPWAPPGQPQPGQIIYSNTFINSSGINESSSFIVMDVIGASSTLVPISSVAPVGPLSFQRRSALTANPLLFLQQPDSTLAVIGLASDPSYALWTSITTLN